MKKRQGKCEISRCRNEHDYTYYGHKVCDRCWIRHCKGDINLKEIFGVTE